MPVSQRVAQHWGNIRNCSERHLFSWIVFYLLENLSSSASTASKYLRRRARRVRLSPPPSPALWWKRRALASPGPPHIHCWLSPENTAYMVQPNRHRLTLRVLNYCYKIHEVRRFFLIWNHHKCLSYVFLIHFNTYVSGLRPLEIY